MRINYDSIKPIYVQVAEMIEDDIVLGRLQEGDSAYSQLVLSRELDINPATAAKGINLLVQKGILERQRGLSMTVAADARKRIVSEKLEKEFVSTATLLAEQASMIGLSKEQALSRISEIFSHYEKNSQHEKELQDERGLQDE